MALRDEQWFHCFGCAPGNPRGLALSPRRTAPGEVSCETTFDGAFCSYPGIVHGGIVSTALDDLMANLLIMEHRALCLSTVLRTRFLSPVLTGRPHRIVARTVGEWPGGYRTEAEITTDDGRLCAAATATYAPMSPEHLHALVAADPDARTKVGRYLTDDTGEDRDGQ